MVWLTVLLLISSNNHMRLKPKLLPFYITGISPQKDIQHIYHAKLNNNSFKKMLTCRSTMYVYQYLVHRKQGVDIHQYCTAFYVRQILNFVTKSLDLKVNVFNSMYSETSIKVITCHRHHLSNVICRQRSSSFRIRL